MEAVEVGIIGAGIHGVSAAFHLARRGVRPRLFERWAPAGGPTGRSSGVCRAYYTNDFLARVARESLLMLRDFRELTSGRDAGHHVTGALFLHGREDAEQVREAAARMNAIGTRIELLGPDDLERRHPDLVLDGVAVGAWEPTAGYADPVLTTAGLFERAVELGLDARLHSRIATVEASAGGGAVLTADDGSRTRCQRLLIAAGPWTRPLAAQVGAELSLTVERHPVGAFGWGGAARLPFVMVDTPNGFYLKPEGAHLFLAGGLHAEPPAHPDDFDQNATQSEVDRMAGALTRRAPGLAAATGRGGWAGLYDVSPDWQPVVGEIADGIFVDAGTSGHGFKLAPGLGRHVADLVAGEPTDPGLAQFHPRRFEAGTGLAAGYGGARILG